MTVCSTPEHAETFHAWGIRTCGQLAALEETDLISRIGQAGKRLHLLARGAWLHLMFPLEPSFEESLSERMELDFPVEMLEPLLFLLARMTDTKVRTRWNDRRLVSAVNSYQRAR